MIYYNITVFTLASLLLGGMWQRKYEIPRILPISWIIGVIIVNSYPDLLKFIAVLWLFIVIRLLPTNSLLTLIHGNPPARIDGRWQFLQEWARIIWLKTPERFDNWYCWGLIYSVLRVSLALPAIIYLGGFAWLAFAQGIVYFIGGRISAKYANKIGEAATGMLIGVLI